MAKIDFYTAESYADLKSPERKAALTAAATAFDDVFQSYRESRVGLHAHLWHGRSVDELGDDQLALDIYDEVLATSPDGRERETGLEPLFALAQYYRLRVILRTAGAEAFLTEAEPWLEFRRAWRRSTAIKACCWKWPARTWSKPSSCPARAKRPWFNRRWRPWPTWPACAANTSRKPSCCVGNTRTKAPLQPIRPRSKRSTKPSPWAKQPLKTSIGRAPRPCSRRALELKPPNVDAEGLQQVANRLDQARYQLALTLYSAGKLSESLASAQQIMRERPAGPTAPAAGSLAVSAALSLYARAQDKKSAFQRLDAIAQEMIRRWPDKAEADDARIALGQASLVRGEFAAAATAFENVNPRPLRYSAALYLAGQTNWRMYLMAKAKGASADVAARDAFRDKAAKQLQTCIDLQREAAKHDPASAGQLDDAKLLLAELKLESGDAPRAAELVEPLAGASCRTNPNRWRIRTCASCWPRPARTPPWASWTKWRPPPRSFAIWATTIPPSTACSTRRSSCWSTPGKRPRPRRSKPAAAGDATRRATAEADVNARRKLVADLAPRLATRKQNSLAALIFIADRSAEVEKTDVARELYTAILAQGEADPAFQNANGAALTRIQAQLVGLLRQKGQFNEALIEVNKLVEQFPNALEPLMEKGRVLQGWADEDPERFDDAVAHWTLLRTRLMRLPRKPPEYYEVVYNAANCLFTDGLKSNDPHKALQAEQLLNATLVLSPKLSGPELVARYKDLLRKSRQLQGSPADAAANP